MFKPEFPPQGPFFFFSFLILILYLEFQFEFLIGLLSFLLLSLLGLERKSNGKFFYMIGKRTLCNVF